MRLQEGKYVTCLTVHPYLFGSTGKSRDGESMSVVKSPTFGADHVRDIESGPESRRLVCSSP